MRSRLKTILLVLLLPFGVVRAQDIHFSQVDANPLLLNPAYTGFFEGNGRFGTCYRTQWGSVTNPYQTWAVTAEVALHRSRERHSGISLGLFAFNDQAGALSYGSRSANLSLGYFKSIDKRGLNIISCGIEGGIGQNGFSTANLDLYDPSETIHHPSVVYPLLAAGAAWFSQPRDNLTAKVGFSARNLNRPNISYLGLDEVYLHTKWNLYSRLEYRYWPDVVLMPLALLQIQHNSRELLLGIDFKWIVDDGYRRLFSLIAGLTARQGDALLVNLGAEYNSFVFTFCYDINYSKLAAASHTIGSFELGLIYRFVKDKRSRNKALSCPVF